MSGGAEGALGVLIANGLISLVRADDALCIVSCDGEAAAQIPIGANLCEAVPQLFGLDEQILSLKRFPGRRVEMTNMALVERDGSSVRQDFVVVCDHASGGFLLSITPSLANSALSVNLEQNLRRRMQLESEVANQARAIEAANEALQRTNADLMNFTRMISHDLKAPMRAIRYSAEDIEASLGETDDPKQASALVQLQTQSRRLSRMVSDLLTYSRLDDKTAAATLVDTHDLVMEITGSLPRPDNLLLEVSGDWPTITTIGVLLDVVIRNLVDNAIKHHDRGQGLITLFAERIGDFLEIVIIDDGPGIPKEYQQAVVKPFLKVKSDTGHNAQDSGLGLSMVHKVTNDVGGRMDIGNRLDGHRGTRICVSWPLTIMAT